MILGIVTEFNPVTLGHKYIIEKSKELFPNSLVVAIMSGDYTVRGEVAIFDKWKRSRDAIKIGVDVVLELPAIFSMNNINIFSMHSIKTLKNLLSIDTLIFGAEHDDKDFFIKSSNYLNNLTVEKNSFNKSISENILIRNKIYNEFGFFPGSNDFLGILYVKNIENDFDFYPIKRVISNYNDNKLTGYSASAIRKYIIKKDSVLLNKNENYYSAIKMAILKNRLSNNINSSDKIRMKNAAFNSNTFEEYVKASYHKRLSKSKVKRESLKAALNFKENWLDEFKNTTFLRPLAASQRGKDYLIELSKKLPIILNYRDLNKMNDDIINLFKINETLSEYYHAFYDNKKHTDRTKNIFNNK